MKTAFIRWGRFKFTPHQKDTEEATFGIQIKIAALRFYLK